MRERTTQSLPVDSGGAAAASVSGRTGGSWPCCNRACRTLISRLAFGRLIRREFVSYELPSLIEDILVCKDVVNTLRCLSRDDAQTFIDVVNEARCTLIRRRGSIYPTGSILTYFIIQALDMPELSPWAQTQCLRPLYRTCGRYALLPKAMEIPTCYDPTGNALYSGGCADVWKGQYLGRDVAVKVIRTFSNSNLAKVVGVSRCVYTLRIPKY